jgi:5-methyltetrahydropteroyltriglutamate--homocysteine methyltransferase
MHPPFTHTLGVPRIGRRRELKRALEQHWRGEIDAAALEQVARAIRLDGWRSQQAAGIDLPASNDFSLYDQVLDQLCLVGAIPRRFDRQEATISTATLFAMARGGGAGQPPLEMTKWFDTNYHYLVPELSPDTRFRVASDKPFRELGEARAAGFTSKPVLVGPLTLLALGKPAVEAPAGWDRLALLEPLLAVYGEVLRRLEALGADWVQLDEPVLAQDLAPSVREALGRAYDQLRWAAPKLRLMVASYFGPLGANLGAFAALPVEGLHVDAVRAGDELPALLEALPRGRVLSVGVVDGRNVWRADLARAWATLERARSQVGTSRLFVAPSCSLLHVPWSLRGEEQLDPALARRLAFADEKLAEVVTLARALRGEPVAAEIEASAGAARLAGPAAGATGAAAAASRTTLLDIAVAGDPSGALLRRRPYAERRVLARETLRLPPLPTTTIGSFPQGPEVRAARQELREGKRAPAAYQALLEAEMARALALQEAAGIDVLVHGEFERTDMVEHFATQLEGFASTEHGWVQSYGSRCVRPPILFGPVRRRGPMTVPWATRAQQRTSRPVKGMLTGPVTILKWSFVREDQPPALSCAEIALAVREEAIDLERAGIQVIQIDEPALREGLPLRAAARAEYLGWSVACFRLAAGGVADGTQVHTHMCYAEFADILPAVIALDADVLTIEASRSALDAVAAFAAAGYPNEIGPGVWDIHAPRVPEVGEIMSRIGDARAAGLPLDRLWLNPDCGLKTRAWPEVEAGLYQMVAAARALRG